MSREFNILRSSFKYFQSHTISLSTMHTNVPVDTLFGRESYTDVTEEFRKAASELKTNELVKRSEFGLLQGVHALEIGHSRMDTGLIYQSLEEQLATAPKIESSGDAGELIDELFAREMSWHTGPMLVQNVFSCWYVEEILETILVKHKEGTLEQWVSSMEVSRWKDLIVVYILGLAKTIDECLMTLMAENYAIYPEEDIVMELSGYDLLHNIDIEVVESLLKKAEAFAQSQGSEVVADKVRFRIMWLKLARQRLADVSELQTLSDKLSKLPEVTDGKFKGVFTETIQSRIDYPCPLRSVLTISREDAWKNFKSILEHNREFYTVLIHTHRATDRMSFVVSFAAKRPRPLAWTRAVLASVLQEKLPPGEATWAIRDISEVMGPEAAVLPKLNKKAKTANPKLAENFMSLIDMINLHYSEMILIFCQNRSRQRQNLSHAIVNWDSLQVTAEHIEQQLSEAKLMDNIKLSNGSVTPALPLSSWIYMRKLQMMIWTVLLGFELEVYQIWEYPVMYGYAHHVIELSKNHLGRIRLYLQGKLQENKTRHQRLLSFDVAHRYVSALELESMALSQLSEANQYLALALEKKKLYSYPSGRDLYTTAKLLYGLRMKPFSNINPEVPRYEETALGMERLTPEFCIAFAKNIVSSTKVLLEQLSSLSRDNPELNLLKRSCAGMGISAALVEKIPQALLESKKAEIQYEGYHWFFPVLSLKNK